MVEAAAKRRKPKRNMGNRQGGFGDKMDERAPVVQEVAELVDKPMEGEPDFWEGEKWENFGTVAQFAGTIIAVLAVGVGFFAANSYNDGAVPVDFQAADSPATAVQIAFEGASKLE